MGGMKRRVAKLEEVAAPGQRFPDWPVEDQCESVLDHLQFRRRFHGPGEVPYPATDREVHLLGLLCASRELGEEGGTHRFPSGLAVTLTPEGENFRVDTPRYVRVEDLPDGVREHFGRMDPKQQPKREAFLYEDRRRAKRDRDRVAWHEEHGWGEPAPEHLRWWVTPGEGGS